MDAIAVINEFGPLDGGLLNFQAMDLSELPEEVVDVEGVTTLWLSNNKYDRLPVEKLARMKSLQQLALEHNELSNFKNVVGVSLVHLEIIYLDFNNLEELDGQLFQALPNLKWLSARDNHLKSISPEIACLTKLEGIRLSNNCLTTVPDEISSLSNLQCLDLEHNQLTSLPHSIGQLAQLQGLFLEGNPQLKYLPMCVMCLSSLRDFTLDSHQANVTAAATEPKEIWRFHVHSLVDICCSFVRAMIDYEAANIPEELKEKLRTQAKKCHFISCSRCNVFFGEGGVVEKISNTTLCQAPVTLRATYCCSHCACADCVKHCTHCEEN